MGRLALFLVLTLLLAPQYPAAQQGGGSAATTPTLDYEMFKARVQPILMSPRKGNARCMACHATGGGNSYLEVLPAGATTYTEDQTRRNFERVSRLVVPGQPLKSLLLINPLAEAAGGSHWHGGGKHWQSQDNAEWQTLATWVRTPGKGGVPPAPAAPAATPSSSPASASPLDYEMFKTRVQPILMSPRKGNARCMSCHATGGGNSYLEVLPTGATAYTEDQTRRNFERVSRLVVPGEPLKSLLLINPLTEAAGGSHWHGGGKHWQSQNDAEWQTLAAWVRSGRS